MYLSVITKNNIERGEGGFAMKVGTAVPTIFVMIV
jgi:hypothetical protein